MNTTKLKNVCVVVSGTTPKSTDERYWNGTHVWITPAELSEDSFIVTDSERHITDEAIKATGLKSFPKGTVLLSSRAPIGKVAIEGCEMYCNQGFKNLICSESIYNLYLYYFLKSKTAYLNSLGRGATFKEISKGIVEDISIPFPVYSEQIRIAKQLQKISELISLKKGQYRYFDDIIRSRFLEMFGMSEGIDKHLEDVADICSGITKGRKVLGLELREVPYMAVSNVKMGYIDLSTIKTIMATENEIEQYRLFPNDILMTEGGDPDKVGRGAIIRNPPKDCIHQNHIFRVRLHKDVLLPEFFEEYLQGNSARRYFLKAAKQTTGIASINMKQLRALPVKIPPIKVQIQYSDFVHQVDKSKLAVQKSLDELEILKKSLMQQYFG